jgi:hypothetical protein
VGDRRSHLLLFGQVVQRDRATRICRVNVSSEQSRLSYVRLAVTQCESGELRSKSTYRIAWVPPGTSKISPALAVLPGLIFRCGPHLLTLPYLHQIALSSGENSRPSLSNSLWYSAE